MHEECGVFGISWLLNVAMAIKLGLFELQHRGQESCGIATSNCETIYCLTRMGLVMGSLDENVISQLPGNMGIGHTRYSTAGSSVIKNAQPFVVDCKYGRLAVAHNGNLTNAVELKKNLQEKGAIFQSSSDTEVVLQLIAHSGQEKLIDAIKESLRQIEGAFCFVFLTVDSIIAVRDPHGFRPLAIGQLPDGGYVFASETCAFRHCNATHFGDVLPGEMVTATGSSLDRCLYVETPAPKTQCVLELVYFSRPNSTVFGRDVYQDRFTSGKLLAKEDTALEADVVIAVPDSGVIAAMGYAEQSGIPYRPGLTRSHYTGRTFIEPTQGQRKVAVTLKLTPIDSVVCGKRVVVVDDSLVRSTTSEEIIKMLRKAGAKEIHWRLASPPIKHPCFYGVDIPDRSQLKAVGRTETQIAEEIGADSVRYLSLESLLASVGGTHGGYCRGCMTGHYPDKLVQIS